MYKMGFMHGVLQLSFYQIMLDSLITDKIQHLLVDINTP